MSIGNGTAPRRAKVLDILRGPDPERYTVRPVKESFDIAPRIFDPILHDGGWISPGYGIGWPGGSWLGGYGYPHERTGKTQPAPAGMLSEAELRGAIVFSRWICERNQLAVGFLGHVTNFVYGDGAEWEVSLRGAKKGAVSTGVTDADADGKADADPAVERCQAYLEAFRKASGWGEGADHFDPQDLDGADRTPKADRQAEAGKRGSRDGNALVRFFRGGSGDDGLPSVRFVEPELIRTPGGDPQPDFYSRPVIWAWGVCTDAEDSETVVAYGIADPLNVSDVEVVPAGRVAHLKLNVDGTVAMGVPDFFCVQDGLETARKLLRNIGEVGVEQAAITYFTEHAEGVTGTQINTMVTANQDNAATRITPYGGATTRPTRLVEPGQDVHVSFGQKITPGPVQNSAPFVAIVQAILRAAGMRWGCPEYFSGDASNANFASTAVAGGPFERAMKRRQKDTAAFEQAVAMRALAFGVSSGKLSADEVHKVTVEVRFPSVAIANKAEDTSRRAQLNQAGVLSPQTWAAEEGYDPAVEFANIQAHQLATAPQPPADPFGSPPGGSPFGEALSEAVTWVAGQHPRDKDGKFIRKNEIDDARGDPAKVAALRAKVRPEDKELLDAHLKDPGHTGDAKAFHPGAQKAGHLRTQGWVAGNQLVDHVGAVLDKVTADGPLTPEAKRDLAVKVSTFVRSKRIPELQNILRSMAVPHSEFVGKSKEDLQRLVADKVKVALHDAEVNYHIGASDPDRQPAGRELAHAESVRESGPPGPPPRPGLAWNGSSRRWIRPDTGEEHPPPPSHGPDVAPAAEAVGRSLAAHPAFKALTDEPAAAVESLLTGPGVKRDKLAAVKAAIPGVREKAVEAFLSAAPDAGALAAVLRKKPEAVAERLKKAASLFARGVGQSLFDGAKDWLLDTSDAGPEPLERSAYAYVVDVHAAFSDAGLLDEPARVGGPVHDLIETAYFGSPLPPNVRASLYADFADPEVKAHGLPPAIKAIDRGRAGVTEGVVRESALPAPGAGHPLDSVGQAILEELGVGGHATEAHGPPPHAGLVFDETRHRWVRPEEAPEGSHAAHDSLSTAAAHPAAIQAAKGLVGRAASLATVVNGWCAANGLTPDVVIGDAQSWQLYFATAHQDILAQHLHIDTQTAFAVLSHLAAHAIDLVRRKLKAA